MCRTIQPAAQGLPAPAVPSTGRLGWTGLDWTEAASHKAAHCCTCRSLLMFRYVIVVLTGAMILSSYLECILFVFAPHMWVRLVPVLLLSCAQDLEMRMHPTDRSGCLWSLRRSGSHRICVGTCSSVCEFHLCSRFRPYVCQNPHPLRDPTPTQFILHML